MERGQFITFEGGEGAGKSTQLKLLAEALERAGIEVVTTREPGGSPGAEAIRALLVTGAVDRWDAHTEALLHTAARRDHLARTVWPALERGAWVICDRFADSTLAYQGYGHGLPKDFILGLTRLAIGDFKPDLTLILDLPVEGINHAPYAGNMMSPTGVLEGDPVFVSCLGSPGDIHIAILEVVKRRLLGFCVT